MINQMSQNENTQNSSTESKEYKVGLYIRLSREDGDNLESESVKNQRVLKIKTLWLVNHSKLWLVIRL